MQALLIPEAASSLTSPRHLSEKDNIKGVPCQESYKNLPQNTPSLKSLFIKLLNNNYGIIIYF